MRYLLLLVVFSVQPAQAQGASEDVRGALAHVMFAYFCPTNDDLTSMRLAQSVLDENSFSETTAQEAFETLEEQQPNVSEMSQAMGCSMVEQIEANHPFR